MIAALLLAGAQAAAAPAPAVAAAPAPIDPQRLAVATRITAKVLPAGTYKRLMGGTMDKLMDSMFDSMGKMPLGQIAALGGLTAEQTADLPATTLGEIMAIYDPQYRERTRIGMRAMMDAMGELMTTFEPQVRAGLARAYARKFTLAQLNDLDAFFATPTGSFYAAESMALYMDPELMAEMQAFAPQLIQRMPEIVKSVEKATAALPPPRKVENLSAEERAKLAVLLGVKPGELTDPPASTLPTT